MGGDLRGSSAGKSPTFMVAALEGPLGPPEDAIPTGLLFFNLRVELGQLAFGVVLALLASLRSLQLSAPGWSWRLASYGIGSVAMHWTIKRVVASAA